MKKSHLKCITCCKNIEYEQSADIKGITCPYCNEFNIIPINHIETLNFSLSSQSKPKDSSFLTCTLSYISNIWDFLTSKGHRLLGIYIFVNISLATILVMEIFSLFTPYSPNFGATIGCILYIIYIILMMSPFGEAYFRFSTGCKKIQRNEDLERITPIFSTVLEKARKLNPQIPEDIKIFIYESNIPNAFATGRKTICLSRSMLQENFIEDDIKAVLAHEFGHISNNDTDVLILLYVGNNILNLCYKCVQIYTNIIVKIITTNTYIIGSDFGGLLGIGLIKIHQTLIKFPIKVWYYCSEYCINRAFQKNEYRADEFAFNLGYGDELCSFLNDWKEHVDKAQSFILDTTSKNFSIESQCDYFSLMISSLPLISDRIAHMKEMGATFQRKTE